MFMLGLSAFPVTLLVVDGASLAMSMSQPSARREDVVMATLPIERMLGERLDRRVQVSQSRWVDCWGRDPKWL